MVLGLRQNDALGRDELCRLGFRVGEGHLHRLHERAADVTDDLTPRRVGLGVEAHLVKESANDHDVVLGLIEVLLPLFLQVFVLRAADRRRVDLDPAHLGLEHLVQKLVQ